MNDMNRNLSDDLCQADRQALDHLLTGGMDLSALADGPTERQRRMARLLGLLDHLPADDAPDDLVERTLAHIDRVRRQEQFSQQIQAISGPGTGGWHWTEIVAVAAMLLVGLSLLVPTIRHSQNAARQFQCSNNLASAGMGFNAYANANAGHLPALRTRPGDTWWNVNRFNPDGTPLSNSANVFLLIRQGYVQPGDLHCPSNKAAVTSVNPTMRDWASFNQISYSYQNMFTNQRPSLHGPTIALYTDKNPLFEPGHYRGDLPSAILSQNHAGLGGQNVLLSPGEVIWVGSPVLNNGDNIFQIRGRTDYQGTEIPGDPFDCFLAP